MAESVRQCRQCGTCCRKGGPVLHRQDLPLVLHGPIHHSHLITIRKGEPVLHPLQSEPKRAELEMIKLGGQGSEWVCCFFNQVNNTCRVYEKRPLECTLLKCWDTEDLEKVICHDTINRIDVMLHDHPAMEYIQIHETNCTWNDCLDLTAALQLNPSSEKTLEALTALIRYDLVLRHQAINRLDISVDLELFYFGRPLFTALHAYGLEIYEHGAEIHIRRTHPV